jgi:hypothetical protein
LENEMLTGTYYDFDPGIREVRSLNCHHSERTEGNKENEGGFGGKVIPKVLAQGSQLSDERFGFEKPQCSLGGLSLFPSFSFVQFHGCGESTRLSDGPDARSSVLYPIDAVFEFLIMFGVSSLGYRPKGNSVLFAVSNRKKVCR